MSHDCYALHGILILHQLYGRGPSVPRQGELTSFIFKRSLLSCAYILELLYLSCIHCILRISDTEQTGLSLRSVQLSCFARFTISTMRFIYHSFVSPSPHNALCPLPPPPPILRCLFAVSIYYPYTPDRAIVNSLNVSLFQRFVYNWYHRPTCYDIIVYNWYHRPTCYDIIVYNWYHRPLHVMLFISSQLHPPLIKPLCMPFLFIFN